MLESPLERQVVLVLGAGLGRRGQLADKAFKAHLWCGG